MYLRYFAETHLGPTGLVGLEFMRSLIRIAPVRLVSLTVQFEGPWSVFGRSVGAPPPEAMQANIVCADPSHWARPITIRMATSMDNTAGAPEFMSNVIELVVPGVRNVLIATSGPTSELERQAADRYEAVIVTKRDLLPVFTTKTRLPHLIPTPIIDPRAVRYALDLP